MARKHVKETQLYYADKIGIMTVETNGQEIFEELFTSEITDLEKKKNPCRFTMAVSADEAAVNIKYKTAAKIKCPRNCLELHFAPYPGTDEFPADAEIYNEAHKSAIENATKKEEKTMENIDTRFADYVRDLEGRDEYGYMFYDHMPQKMIEQNNRICSIICAASNKSEHENIHKIFDILNKYDAAVWMNNGLEIAIVNTFGDMVDWRYCSNEPVKRAHIAACHTAIGLGRAIYKAISKLWDNIDDAPMSYYDDEDGDDRAETVDFLDARIAAIHKELEVLFKQAKEKQETTETQQSETVDNKPAVNNAAENATEKEEDKMNDVQGRETQVVNPFDEMVGPGREPDKTVDLKVFAMYNGKKGYVNRTTTFWSKEPDFYVGNVFKNGVKVGSWTWNLEFKYPQYKPVAGSLGGDGATAFNYAYPSDMKKMVTDEERVNRTNCNGYLVAITVALAKVGIKTKYQPKNTNYGASVMDSSGPAPRTVTGRTHKKPEEPVIVNTGIDENDLAFYE